MGAAPAALLLAALAMLLLRHDLRLPIRRRHWLRARAEVERVPDARRPALRLRIALPDGRILATETADLRQIARLEPGVTTDILLDPRDPSRFDLPRPPGLAAAAGLLLMGLAVAALLR